MRNSIHPLRHALAAVMLGVVACQDPPTGPEAVQRADGATPASQGPGPIEPQPAARIAFVGEDSADGLEVHTIERTGDGLTKLTNIVGDHIWDVEWSPGGPSRLAFHTYEHVYVMAANGTGLQDITPAGGHHVWDLVWSPDGTKLAMRTQTPLNGPLKLWVLNADGSGFVPLASDPDYLSPPAWSPDGQRLMYSVRTDHPRTLFDDRGVWTIKPDGTGRTKVPNVSNGSIYDHFQYSPDGTKVAMCRDGQSIVMKSDGTGLTGLGVHCYSEDGPQWSPNGTRILTRALVGNRVQLFTVDPDGTDKVQLTSGNISSDHPTWSRGGGWIAFRRGATGGTMDLWVMKADGSEKTQLTFDMSLDYAVSWGPTPTFP